MRRSAALNQYHCESTHNLGVFQVIQSILWLASGVSNKGGSSPRLGLLPNFLRVFTVSTTRFRAASRNPEPRNPRPKHSALHSAP